MMPSSVPLLTVVCAAGLAITGPAVATPPPPEQIAANCAAPTYASDMLVCGDQFMRALDARMRDAWSAVDFAAIVAPGGWVEPQAAWFRRRSLCAFAERHAECLQAAYVERIAVLEVLRLVASRPPRQGVRVVCRDAPWGEGPVHVRAPATGALAVEDGEARVRATAIPMQSDGAWTPYVGFASEGRTIRLQPIDGPPITCRPLDPPSGGRAAEGLGSCRSQRTTGGFAGAAAYAVATLISRKAA
jgi:uncharacterized protein